MTDVPTQFILAAFKTENGADEALEQLKKAQKEHLIDINNVAVLRRDQQGKVHVKEPTDMGGGKGALIGGGVGALAGLLFAPVGLAIAGGAALGGLAAKMHDSGFNDDRLRKLGNSLEPGTSCILAVIEHTWVRELEAQLQQAGADIVTEELGADIAKELKAGHQVGYTVVATNDAMLVARATDAEPAEGDKAATPTQAPPTPAT
jgi:uncharacterized membrane protein